MHDFIQRLKIKLPAIASALVILFILVGLDQWTKWAIVKSIPLGDSLEIVPGFFELTYVRNSGAAFSSFDGIGMWFFITITLIEIGVMIYYFFRSDNSKIDFALALLMSGAIGNLIDRIHFGYVRDFFLFYIFGSPFAIFNVADVCITLGFIILMFALLFPGKKNTDPSSDDAFQEKKDSQSNLPSRETQVQNEESEKTSLEHTIKFDGREVFQEFLEKKEQEELVENIKSREE